MIQSSAVSQLCLRPFDVGVALRLLLSPEERYEPLSHALATSTSAVHRSVSRLRLARICKANSRTIDPTALIEFAVCGVPYTFPSMRVGAARGMPTGLSHAHLQHLRSDSEPQFVWASARHGAEGEAIVPLFHGVVQVAERDPRMHQLLSIVEALRVAQRKDRDPLRACLEDAVRAVV